MHCPRCGQQQISNQIKFCSRCGLPLEIVAEVLSHDGFLPQLNYLQENKKWFTRKSGLKIALLWFAFFMFFLLPLATITDAPEEVVIAIVTLSFTVGFLISLLSWLFLPSSRETVKNKFEKEQFTTRELNKKRVNAELLPLKDSTVSSYVPPAAGLWKAPDTGELVPYSVTDHTTKLLQKDE